MLRFKYYQHDTSGTAHDDIRQELANQAKHGRKKPLPMDMWAWTQGAKIDEAFFTGYNFRATRIWWHI